MSAIAGSVSLAAPAKARGLGFKSSAPMGSRVAATAVPVRPNKAQRGALKVVAGNANEGGLFAPIVISKHLRSPSFGMVSPFATSYSRCSRWRCDSCSGMYVHIPAGTTVSHAPESMVTSIYFQPR